VPLGPKRRRPAVLIGALAGTALLIAGGVFAGVKLSQHPRPVTATAPNSAAAPPKPAPNTGPFTGASTVAFGRVTGVDGKEAPGATPTTETWGVRSVCRPDGCLATASRLTGETMQIATMVFDQVGGSWLAVSVGSTTCGKAEGEVWETYSLQTRSDGTLSGESTQTMVAGCANRRTVTFARTGDVDVNSLPDPATLPPRVVSPAEALRGRYHQTDVTPNGYNEGNDYVVRTDCVRTGDRCMTLFHRPPAAALALVFGDGKWIYDRESDNRCSKGGTAHVKIVAQFPLPQPPQDPITLLSGHGREDVTGASACPSTDVDIKFARTGD